MAYRPPLYGGITGNTAGNNALISTGTLYLAGGNNVTLSQTTGAGGGTITINGPAVPSGSINFSASNASSNLGSVKFSNSNGVSFGLTTGSIITASHNALTSQTLQTSNNIQAVYGANAAVTASTGTVAFNNANGVSFGLAGNTMTASHNALTTARASNDAIGLNTAQTNATWTVNSAGLSLNAAGYAGTGFSGTNATGTVNSNGLQLSVQAGGGAAVSAAGNSISNGTVVFSNSNGVGFGMAGSTVTASHNAITSQSNQTLAMTATGVNTTQNTTATMNATSMIMSGGGGVSMGFSNNTMYVSGPGASSLSATGAVSISTNAQTISIGAPYFQAGISNLGSTSGTSNSVASQTRMVLAGSNITLSQATAAGGNTVTISAAPMFDAGVSNTAAGGTTYGTMGSNLTNGLILYAGSNIGLSQSTNAGGNASVTIQAANGGGGGGGVALSAGGALYSSGTLNLSNAGGALTMTTTPSSVLNFSVPGTSSLVGTNGISVSSAGGTISIDGNGLSTLGGGGGGGATLSYFNPQDAYLQVVGQHGQGTLHIQPMQAPNIVYDRIAVPYVFSGATNSTASVTLSHWIGIYTRTASTLSQLTSYSTSTGYVHSGTVNTSLYLGMRLLTLSNDGDSLGESQYWVGHAMRSTTAGANASISQILASQMNSTFYGIFGVASNVTNQYTRGLGYYSASTTAVPVSIAFSQIRGVSSQALRQPLFYLVSGTF